MARKKSGKRRDDEAPDDAELHPPGTLSLDELPLDQDVDKRFADAEVFDLQERLHELQLLAWLDKRRVVFVFEGQDAAGKGGVIRRLTAPMDPRGYKVWPLTPPDQEEHTLHYLWRFAARMPLPGTITIFDRSWYDRVLGERVEGLATPEEWRRAYAEINAFERMHTCEGLTLVKFYLHIDKRTQLQRFKQRARDPMRNFKLGEEDWGRRKHWGGYQTAAQDMLDSTHRPDAPWVLVPANDRRHARLVVLRRAIEALGG
jgi:polyphosphate kinase 2 (PPK2 family)